MATITWDQTGTRYFETGVDHGVLYVAKADGSGYETGVAWNGLTTVTESPSGAETSASYADNMKYLNLTSAEDFGATIEAYTYPNEFELCDGTADVATGVTIGQQSRRKFAFSYRTRKGNDVVGDSYGYDIHIIYGAQAQPSEKAYATVNDSPEAISFSWEISTTPVNVTGYNPTALIKIDSTKTDPTKLKSLEDKLYGTASEEPTLLLPDEIIALIGAKPASNSGVGA